MLRLGSWAVLHKVNKSLNFLAPRGGHPEPDNCTHYAIFRRACCKGMGVAAWARVGISGEFNRVCAIVEGIEAVAL